MSAQDTIKEKLSSDPFEPFRIVTSSGDRYDIRNPHLVALMKSQVFIATPGSDRSTYVLYLHVSAIETIGNGHPRRRGRKGK